MSKCKTKNSYRYFFYYYFSKFIIRFLHASHDRVNRPKYSQRKTFRSAIVRFLQFIGRILHINTYEGRPYGKWAASFRTWNFSKRHIVLPSAFRTRVYTLFAAYKNRFYSRNNRLPPFECRLPNRMGRENALARQRRVAETRRSLRVRSSKTNDSVFAEDLSVDIFGVYSLRIADILYKKKKPPFNPFLQSPGTYFECNSKVFYYTDVDILCYMSNSGYTFVHIRWKSYIYIRRQWRN